MTVTAMILHMCLQVASQCVTVYACTGTVNERATAKKRLEQRDNMIPRIAVGTEDPRLFDIAPGRLPDGIYDGLNKVARSGKTKEARAHATAIVRLHASLSSLFAVLGFGVGVEDPALAHDVATCLYHRAL